MCLDIFQFLYVMEKGECSLSFFYVWDHVLQKFPHTRTKSAVVVFNGFIGKECKIMEYPKLPRLHFMIVFCRITYS